MLNGVDFVPFLYLICCS